jgi:DNA polymerase I-like protein with 3'-5' exonuclease and polymerase domains
MKHCRDDGRIHAHINQIRSDDGGTVSGRISMSNPNLQQIPARDPELGPMIRSLFLPEEGEQWAAIDFSQQEPRILVHYAHVYGQTRGIELEKAAEFVDAYQSDPDMDFHTMVAEMAKVKRKQAKTINLAMMYGMGVNKLAEQLDIPTEVDIYQSGRIPLIQIHDEIAMSVTSTEDAQGVAAIMEAAVPLEVPNKCDVEIGPSWGEAV